MDNLYRFCLLVIIMSHLELMVDKSKESNKAGLLSCGFNNSHSALVPLSMFERNSDVWRYPYGNIKKKYYGREINKRLYISPNGFVYCSLKCFSDFCAD